MKKKKKKVTVVGGSGYTGLELLRLLFHHPGVEVVRVTSRQYEGIPVRKIFPSLGERDLTFEAPDVKEMAKDSEIVFTAVPHQKAMELIPQLVKQSKCKIIDLSADFRIREGNVYEHWYDIPHEAPWLLDEAVYGLPEIHGQEIKKARLIGNPGCYPTSIILGIAPLLKEKLIKTDPIIADSKSGVSGAGRSLSLGSLFSEAGEGFKAYKVGGGHRHIPEIEQELSLLARETIKLTFTPHLVPMSRGILSTIYTRPVKKISFEDLAGIYREYYGGAPFVRFCDKGEWPTTLQVRGSNYCQIGWSLDKRTGHLIVLSAIDNLVKGASGQAIQNMNILFGWDETIGLTQLPLYP
jgi:N-acetyl-gamma-glutamyl-phosphate reductase